MFGTVDFARPKIADQQLITAEHIQRQVTVVIVVTMEEPPFLITVDAIIGRIKVYCTHRWIIQPKPKCGSADIWTRASEPRQRVRSPTLSPRNTS